MEDDVYVNIGIRATHDLLSSLACSVPGIKQGIKLYCNLSPPYYATPHPWGSDIGSSVTHGSAANAAAPWAILYRPLRGLMISLANARGQLSVILQYKGGHIKAP